MYKKSLILAILLATATIAKGSLDETMTIDGVGTKTVATWIEHNNVMTDLNHNIGSSNAKDIGKNFLSSDKNKNDIIAINKEMKDHQSESDLAISQLKEQDIQLKKQDEAIFEVIGNSRDINGEPIRESKIKNNRDRIVTLEGQTKTVDENKTEIDKNRDNIATNKDDIKVNKTNMAENKTAISDNSQRITNLDNKVNNLQGEMNKGFAMSAAMATVDFQSLEVGELGIGAGLGNYQNAQAVSLGLGLRATDNLSLNVKGAMSTGTKQETMVGAGATYKIRVFGS